MEPVKRPRAVLSVAFSREDFERICDEAKRRNMKVSAYVRAMAVNSAGNPNTSTATTGGWVSISSNLPIRREP